MNERPPFFEEKGHAFMDYEKAYAADKLTAYQQLAADIDAIRTKVAVKISAHSHGQDEIEGRNFNVSVRAFSPAALEHIIVHGYSAPGLQRAVLNAKWLESMGKYADVRIAFTFAGITSYLSRDDYAIARRFANVDGELIELRSWCRDYMKEWD